MAHRFGFSDGYTSKVFSMWVIFLCAELKALFKLSDLQSATAGQAATFAPFGKLYMVLDATELYSQAPSNSKAKKQMYSQYKSHYTYKYLV